MQQNGQWLKTNLFSSFYRRIWLNLLDIYRYKYAKNEFDDFLDWHHFVVSFQFVTENLENWQFLANTENIIVKYKFGYINEISIKLTKKEKIKWTSIYYIDHCFQSLALRNCKVRLILCQIIDLEWKNRLSKWRINHNHLLIQNNVNKTAAKGASHSAHHLNSVFSTKFPFPHRNLHV